MPIEQTAHRVDGFRPSASKIERDVEPADCGAQRGAFLRVRLGDEKTLFSVEMRDDQVLERVPDADDRGPILVLRNEEEMISFVREML